MEMLLRRAGPPFSAIKPAFTEALRTLPGGLVHEARPSAENTFDLQCHLCSRLHDAGCARRCQAILFQMMPRACMHAAAARPACSQECSAEFVETLGESRRQPQVMH